ncbi:MAG: bifunctional phosphopantothenoylcysteine decarboxylase/phosphopantothenate--cysteine ligase CoaBC, partial [Bacteroidota bacterium]
RVQHNIHILKADGVHVLETGTGYLASGLQGPGRLLEPEEILASVEQLLAHNAEKKLAHKRVLISAGPTQEALDPVRYITNHSSGKMGYALAEMAQAWGAEVHLVSGPTALPSPQGVHFYPVVSAKEMFETIKDMHKEQDILIMAAAVSDYAPPAIQAEKIKKQGDTLELTLHKTTDILKYLGNHKGMEQFLVGFALETNNARAHAEQKLRDKNLDLIVLNSLEDKGAGFGHNTNKVTLIDRGGEVQTYPLKSKKEVAVDILEKIVQLISL